MEPSLQVGRSRYEEMWDFTRQAWQAAYAARQPYDPRWERQYRQYRSYVKPRRKGDWRSRVFMPESFQTVETILPHLVAQLPKFMVEPFGPEDVEPSKVMDRILHDRVKRSGVHKHLIDAMRNALIIGTGILKTHWETRYEHKRGMEPAFQSVPHEIRKPLIDPDTRLPMRDEFGEEMFETEQMTVQLPLGMKPKRDRYAAYDGPMATNIDPMNFWVAPESETLDSARYAIHRSYQPWREVLEWAKKGIYTFPDDFDIEEFFQPSQSFPDDPHDRRMGSIDMGYQGDPTRKQVEIKEYWTDDGMLITVANDRAIIRIQENPFDHSAKPFVVVYDYKMPHEFWGVGEVEVIEGLQDLINALSNQRIDNVRMGMDQMYAVNKSQLANPAQLTKRPGGIVETLGDGMNPNEVIYPLPTTEVTSSAFAEVDQARNWSERATSVSAYQRGEMSPSLSDTATGIATLMEAGASRFNLKAIYMNLESFTRLGKHFGSLLQQFTTEETYYRLVGEHGQVEFPAIMPEQLMGAFDISIEPASVSQSETIKKEQALGLFREIAPVLMQGPVAEPVKLLLERVMDAYGLEAEKPRMLQAIAANDQQMMMQALQMQQQAPQ